MPSKKKQVKARLRIHLLQGKSITQLQAYELWKTTRLAVYIRRLREDGMRIKMTMVNAGKETSFAKYQHVY